MPIAAPLIPFSNPWRKPGPGWVPEPGAGLPPTVARQFRSGQPVAGPGAPPQSRAEQRPAVLAEGLASPWNQQTFERLKLSLTLQLRRQLFIAVCDDRPLRDRLAARLANELGAAPTQGPLGEADDLGGRRWVSLQLDPAAPDPRALAARWRAQHPGQAASFQLLGIDRLMRQAAHAQRLFLGHLAQMGQAFGQMESSWLLWVPRPWLYVIQHSAAEFWRWHTGLFEFEGEPTLTEASPVETAWTPTIKATTATGGDGASLAAQDRPAAPLARPLAPEDGRASLAEQDRPANLVHFPAGLAAQDRPLEPLEAETAALPPELSAAPVWPADLVAMAESYRQRARQAATRPEGAAAAQADWLAAARALERALAQVAAQSDLQPTLQPTTGDGGISLAEQHRPFYRLWQQDLGTIYSELARYGEPVAYLQRAIAAYEAATELGACGQSAGDKVGGRQEAYPTGRVDPQASSPSSGEIAPPGLWPPLPTPQWYASALNNLGTARWQLAQHQAAQNFSAASPAAASLRGAIAAYEQALACYRDTLNSSLLPGSLPVLPSALRQQLPPDASYGTIQANRATAYLLLARYGGSAQVLALGAGEAGATPSLGERACLQAAIMAGEIALPYRSDRPAAYAATQNNLGAAYSQLAQHSSLGSSPRASEYQPLLQAAIAAYEAALAVDPALPVSFDRAATAGQLALVRYRLAQALAQTLPDALTNSFAEGTASRIPQQQTAIDLLHAAVQAHLYSLQSAQARAERTEGTITALVETLRALQRLGGPVAQQEALAKIPARWVAKLLDRLG